ncbi:putative addiction module killer protein [Methylobacterium sp. PvP062]|uniref:Addiction module killer protein n=1 Tax=Methylobacterium radiotolerans TaxID=31998 RepID=A0ABV2NQ88_9HYPH|nr:MULTISPECIES: type II toxin-antitoxin system RelE/ParE family toxin [unclassified Methylobacterium]MBP2494735.1 putative addiction module killer protein [Methylobacterium sp. PvP105]MBP2505394.1 putative addiction module killer protein [Methylobacterium sp. PvP109]MCX7334684.1 type II toxin-antitoxin system RelE/ParE family toxin [Hyphomicrobiales bacterium]
MPTVRRLPDFADWLRDLRDARAVARIGLRLDRLKLGNPGQCRGVGDDVHEMKIDYGPGYRVYFTNRGAELIILLCGGDKSTQENDIVRAKKLAKTV